MKINHYLTSGDISITQGEGCHNEKTYGKYFYLAKINHQDLSTIQVRRDFLTYYKGQDALPTDQPGEYKYII